ncbi:hypothetical protein Rvan_2662 [Rhodomicrobium vannielii ATCC 17100]|uniref:Uncharacterized protein n=1 Tax=Rhodomicrobium vannielii (strain ATCC 17100 / DSM 162 / LMG 4299 / NCIMB 10020 / ATH 3.1.1) TaxID=648757 RepID=E3I7F5_RHOVT|nr:hypothetical protein [Rhodomicrobium vannielii]ADP71874.1 hypothetical protein Rvan_2662 [Rhodomicrobium vannielii ATCC 17100]
MADIITDVHSISSGTDWFFLNETATELAQFEGVACFALVTTRDEIDISRVSKRVIALARSQLEFDLIGEKIELMTNILSRSEALQEIEANRLNSDYYQTKKFIDNSKAAIADADRIVARAMRTIKSET